MSFTSTGFVLFVTLTTATYYLTPKRFRWVVLLAASYIFYALNSTKALVYIAGTTAVSFWCAVSMSVAETTCRKRCAELDKSEREARKALKEECKRQKKRTLTGALLVCFGILVVLKYTNFVISNIGALFLGADTGDSSALHFSFILPLGISFYTFQITSYLFDVYNAKYEAEKNFFHYALYVSYFPALLQGPISRWNDIKKELFDAEHPFSLKNTEFAVQRILWGFLKKLVIADRAAEVVTYIFDNHADLPWYITGVGLIFYSIKLYADFSGGMDVALGVSELFGVKLAENFRQPFFSESISEFWRRWHITLGTWMKDYVFYPFALSKPFAWMGKKLSKCTIKLWDGIQISLGKAIPVGIGNLLVFFVVGVWHGAEWHFIVYGLYNGLIICLSTLCKPVFEWFAKRFPPAMQPFLKGWRVLRTFILVNISWVFDEVADLTQSFSMLRQLFSFGNGALIHNWRFDTFSEKTIFTVLFFCAVWLVVSILKEKGTDVRERIALLPIPARWVLYLALVLSTPFFQAANMEGFIYAQF